MNLFIILGAPRSGSKVYSNFINNSFDVKVFEEFHFNLLDFVGKSFITQYGNS